MRLSTRKVSLSELTLFSMFGAIMFLSRFVLQAAPNIHLLATFIAAYTLSYRAKALIPIYVYVLLEGVASGFSLWWYPYLYIWLPLWGAFMLICYFEPPRKVRVALYMVTCALHGLSFGIMYAPAQAFISGLSYEGMLAWVMAGLPFDIAHAIGNFFLASLITPLHALLRRL